MSVARFVLIETAASLIEVKQDPSPTLLRAQFAAELDHLPSVPSVVCLIYKRSRHATGLARILNSTEIRFSAAFADMQFSVASPHKK
jgi:hypothetical protein